MRNTASKYQIDVFKRHSLGSKRFQLLSDSKKERNESFGKYINNNSISTHYSDRNMEQATERVSIDNAKDSHWFNSFITNEEYERNGQRKDLTKTKGKPVLVMKKRQGSMDGRRKSKEQRKLDKQYLPLTPKASSYFDNPFKTDKKREYKRDSFSKPIIHELLTKNLKTQNIDRKESFDERMTHSLRNSIKQAQSRSKSPIMIFPHLSSFSSTNNTPKQTVSMRNSFIGKTNEIGLRKSLIWSKIDTQSKKPLKLKSILKGKNSKRGNKRVQVVESRNEVILVSKWIQQSQRSICDMIQIPVVIIKESFRQNISPSQSNVQYNTDLSFGFEQNLRQSKKRVRAPTPYKRQTTSFFDRISL